MAEFLVMLAIQATVAVGASVLINALFPVRIEGPRLSDTSVQTSTYGNAIPLLLGRTVPVSGNIFWMSNGGNLVETASTEGGKGGPEVTRFNYSTSIAVGLGERPGGCAGLAKIWANGKLIYDAELASPGNPQTDFPTFTGSVELLLGAVAGTVTLPLNQENAASHIVFESIAFYPGDFTQTPDPTIEADLGVGEVPGYRGTCYVVIKNLQLADFGNVIPQLRFLVIPNPEETYRSAVEIVVDRAGISSNDYNFNCLTDPLYGYAIGRVVTASQALQPLTFAGYFDIIDDAGNLRGNLRDDEAIAIISTDDLGGHAFGDDRPDPISWERVPTLSLPREATITFFDPARDFQSNAQTARRSAGTADSNIAVELPLVLPADDGRALADRALWEAWLTAQIGKTTSTDRLIDMRVGRVYLFETPAGIEPLRVTSKTRGRNGVIEWELQRERPEMYPATSPGTSGTGLPPQEIEIPGPTELILLDIPILRDADDDSGFYFGVVGSETNWRGAAVMRALSVSDDFVTFQSAGVESVVGDVQGTLGNGPTELDGSGGTFDDDSFIDVDLRYQRMTLESISDDAVNAGGNAAFIGNPDDTTEGEIIQFGNAELQSGNIWRLTHLKRGKRGTEFATGLHGAGEIFVLLQDTGATMRKDFGVSDLDLERAYKAVSLLLSVDDAAAVLFTDTSVGLRPYSPIYLDVSGDTGGDLILSWARRSRLDSGALGEEAEVYNLRIMDALGTTIEREVNPTEATFAYTLAMQTADFGGAVADLNWRVAQVSAVYGNGIFATWSGPIPVSG